MTIASTARDVMRRADPLSDSFEVDVESSLRNALDELTETVEPDFVIGLDNVPATRFRPRRRTSLLVAAAVIALAAGFGTALIDQSGRGSAPGTGSTSVLTAPGPTPIISAQPPLACNGSQRCGQNQTAAMNAARQMCGASGLAILQQMIDAYRSAAPSIADRAALDLLHRTDAVTVPVRTQLEALWRSHRADLLSSGPSMVGDQLRLICSSGS
jgi:hypothetical protein